MATTPRVDFTFDPPSGDTPVDGYRLYRSPAGNNSFSLIVEDKTDIFAGDPQLQDTTVQHDTDYDYKVLAFNSAGEGDPVELLHSTGNGVSIPEDIMKAENVSIDYV